MTSIRHFVVPSLDKEGWRHPSSLSLLPRAGEGNILLPSPLRGEGSGVRLAPGWLDKRVTTPPAAPAPLLDEEGKSNSFRDAFASVSRTSPLAARSAGRSSRDR